MWIGYTLDRQRRRQRVLDGAGSGRGVGPEDDRVRAGAWASLKMMKTVADKPNCQWRQQPQTLHSSKFGEK